MAWGLQCPWAQNPSDHLRHKGREASSGSSSSSALHFVHRILFSPSASSCPFSSFAFSLPSIIILCDVATLARTKGCSTSPFFCFEASCARWASRLSAANMFPDPHALAQETICGGCICPTSLDPPQTAMDETDYTKHIFLRGPGGQTLIRLDDTTREEFRAIADRVAGFAASGGETPPERDAGQDGQLLKDLAYIKKGQADTRRQLDLLLGLRGIASGAAAALPIANPAHPGALASYFLLHGFLELDAALPDELLTRLAEVCISQADSWAREADAAASGKTERTSINHKTLLKEPVFRQLMDLLIDPKCIVCQVLNNCFGDAWWIERAGGDVVAGHARYQERPCRPHADWPQGEWAMIVISVQVHRRLEGQGRAPLTVYSRSTHTKFVWEGERGKVLMRDSALIHHGDANKSAETRALPALRIMLPAALHRQHDPPPIFTEADMAAMAPDTAQRCRFLWQECRTPFPETPKYRMPLSMECTCPHECGARDSEIVVVSNGDMVLQWKTSGAAVEQERVAAEDAPRAETPIQ